MIYYVNSLFKNIFFLNTIGTFLQYLYENILITIHIKIVFTISAIRISTIQKQLDTNIILLIFL